MLCVARKPDCAAEFYGIKQRYDESNNVFVFFLREATASVTDRLASFFSETETAKAMREIGLRDPSFHLEQFMRDAHELIIPEILDAIIQADLPTLRLWCSEATYSVLKSTFEAQLKPGTRMEGRILDLRHIEVPAPPFAHALECSCGLGRWPRPS